MDIPHPKEVIAHANGIRDKTARLKFIEIQMDAASRLSQSLWDQYSLLSSEIIYPTLEAARAVCEYDWSDNDDDAVAAIQNLRDASDS